MKSHKKLAIASIVLQFIVVSLMFAYLIYSVVGFSTITGDIKITLVLEYVAIFISCTLIMTDAIILIKTLKLSEETFYKFSIFNKIIGIIYVVFGGLLTIYMPGASVPTFFFLIGELFSTLVIIFGVFRIVISKKKKEQPLEEVIEFKVSEPEIKNDDNNINEILTKLTNVSRLKEKGLITDEEYSEMKNEILKDK